MRSLGALALLLVAAVSACEAPTADGGDVPGARNLCSDSSTCPSGSTCVDRICLALPPSSLDLVAEITPSVGSGLTPIPRYLSLPQLLSQRTFFDAVDEAGVSGALVMPSLDARTYSVPQVPAELLQVHPGCAFSQAALVATLTASGALAGLAPGATAKVDADRHATLAVQDVPYDLYVRPELHAAPGDGCQVSPFLVRAAEETTALPAMPKQLRVRLLVPTSAGLAGYRAEILDQATGLRVSTVGRLYETPAPGELVAGVSEAGGTAPIDYHPPLPGGGFWLVLTPPQGKVGPKLAFDASFFGADETVLDLSTLAVSLTKVEARLVTPGTVAGTTVASSGTLLVRAKSAPGIDGIPPGVLAWFEAEAKADPSTGIAELVVPAGVYDAVAMGGESGGIARSASPWELRPPKGQSGVFGLSLLIPPRVDLSVTARAMGQVAQRVGVQWAPVPSPKGGLETMFRGATLSPRRGGAATDDSGTLSDALDQGTYDLSVRFDPRSAFPWVVVPEVLADTGAPLVLEAPSPFEIRGTILVPEAGVPSANLLPLAGGTLRLLAKRSGRLVPVGLAAIDAFGAFRAFAPSSFVQP